MPGGSGEEFFVVFVLGGGGRDEGCFLFQPCRFDTLLLLGLRMLAFACCLSGEKE